LVLLAACSSGSEEEANSTIPEGQRLYTKSCAMCHGKDLKNGSAPQLDQVGTKYTSEQIEQIILEGKGKMPKEILTGEDAKTVADWLAQQK